MQPRMIQGSNPGRNKIFISSPKHPGQLFGLSNLLFNGYQRPVPHG